MSRESTRETQYQRCVDLRDTEGLTPLGLMANQSWHDDPKHLVFTLSRYKFVSKMLSGRRHVLEVGCADAFGTRIVRSEVGRLTAVDFDPVFIRDAEARMDSHWQFDLRVHNIIDGPVEGDFDAAYALDVLEHIDRTIEHLFFGNLVDSIDPHGVVIVGSPSRESQVHASPLSKAGHVKCKSGKELKQLCNEYFHSVFVFSMNDEVVHTGYYPMAHYLLAVCCDRK